MNSARGGPAGPPPGAGDRGGGDRGSLEPRTPRGVTVAAYVALCLLGAFVGLIGTFHYGQGPAPLAAVLFDLAILAICVLGSVGMRTSLGGVLPAAGWFAVTLLLSSSSAGGSVLVTDTTAGKWFLFGGAVCAAAGGVYAFAAWSKPSRDHRAKLSSGPDGDRGPENRSRQSSGSARTPRRPSR